MRQRVEDLGRLLVHLYDLRNCLQFDFGTFSRPKYSWEAFSSLPDENKKEIINSIAYAMEETKFKIDEMIEIAEGFDKLNEVTNDCFQRDNRDS